jgi:tripartite-type tricarboxylate transporter receptor subunit TctC
MLTRHAFAFGLSLLAAAPVFAQESAGSFPSKPVKFIVPYAAGGLPDTVVRIVGQRATENTGQQFIVENRPGAGGFIAIEALKRADKDGYTLLVVDPAHVAINQALYKSLPYDPARDFTPVTLLGTSPLFLVAHNSLAANTLPELVKLAKSKPGQLNYGSGGSGSIHHLTMESLKASLGLDIVHVPYKGTGQAVPALVGGQIALLFSTMPAIAAHVKSGSVKLLGASTAKRSPQAPDVPSIAELGVPGYDFAAETGIVAPAGTPAPIVAKLADELGKATRHPESTKKLVGLGIDPVASSPQAYAAHIKASVERYGRAVKVSGATAD